MVAIGAPSVLKKLLFMKEKETKEQVFMNTIVEQKRLHPLMW